MAGEMAPRQLARMELAAFHAFRDAQTGREKWELIDGVAVMMPPPLLVHQRISGNLERMLNACLAINQPMWRADREIGLLVPEEDTYNPEPDVTVIDLDVEMGQLYAARFYFVAEVLSASDKDWVLSAKLSYYQRHDNCLSVLFIRQDRIAADFYRRSDGWVKAELLDPTAQIEIPGIGPIGSLSDLYQYTPLALPSNQG
jgi:Uma2 family endonuclease